MSTNHTSDLPQVEGQAPAIDGLVEQGSPADMAVQVAQAGSAAGGTAPLVIEVSPGAQIDLSDISLEGSTMTLDGQDLKLVLADGTEVTLHDFITASLSDNPPTFQFGGGLQMSAADMLANATPAAGGELPPGVAPAAGTAGTQDDDGSTVAPEAQGPIGPGAEPTGPLGPTSLAFTAPEPELGVVFLESPAAVEEEEVPQEEVCEEITCAQLFSAYMSTWNGPVGGRISPDDVPDESNFDYVASSNAGIFEGTKGSDLLFGEGGFGGAQAILGHGDDDWILAADDNGFNAVHGDTPYLYSWGDGVPDFDLPFAHDVGLQDLQLPEIEGGGVPGDDVIFGGNKVNTLEILVGGGGNDYVDGQAGDELIVGDEVALTYKEEDYFFGGGPKNEINSSYLQIGNSYLTATDYSYDRSDNYNDVLLSGDGHAIMVGDLAATGVHVQKYFEFVGIGEGDEPIYDESSRFDIAFSEGVFLGAGAFDGGSVNAFNDFIDAETVAGVAEGAPLLAEFGYLGEGFGSALIGDVAALGEVGELNYYNPYSDDYPNIALTASLFGVSEGGGDGGSVTAFNDDLCGTELSDLLVGDVLQVGFYGEGNDQIIMLTAEGFGTSGGSVDAYNDTLLGYEGDDLLVGDVMAMGLAWYSTTDLWVENMTEGSGYYGLDADGNTYNAFNDRIRPGEGRDESVGDAYVVGDMQYVDLWAGNLAESYYYDYGNGGASADNNTFYAFNDEICEEGGSALAVGDVFAEGSDNGIWLGAENFADGSYGEGYSASNNTFTVFSDVLHGDHGEAAIVSEAQLDIRGGSLLVGDVLTEDEGDEYGSNVDLSVYNGADNFYAYSEAYDAAGGVANNNTFNAFNDTLVGTNSSDTMVGDLMMHADMVEGSLSVENEAWGTTYYANADGGEVNNNTFNAFNDSITGSDGLDYAVGDSLVSGIIDGGDQEWPYLDGPGFQMYASNYAMGTYGEGGEANNNTFDVFNDTIDIGDGGGVAVGDLSFGGWGNGDIDLDVVNVAEGAGGGYFGEYGGDNPDGGDASNNTFNAFNDTITGGVAEGYYDYPAVAAAFIPYSYVGETLVGDVLFDGWAYCDVPELELRIHNVADQGYSYGAYGEGGTADNNTFNAYNDVMIGGPEDGPTYTIGDEVIELTPYASDIMVGDVMAEGAGDIDLQVFNSANDHSSNAAFPLSSASDNTFNAFNDEMTLGFGEGIMVGDVYAQGACGECGEPLDIQMTASNYTGYAAVATGNEFNVFNDTITGHDYDDEIVGDVYIFGGKLHHLEMGLYNSTAYGDSNYSDSYQLSDASGNTFYAFNDTIDARDGDNHVTGDVYYESYEGCDSEIELAAFGTYGSVGEGGGTSGDQFTAWSDTIDGGDHHDQIIGDLEIGNESYGIIDTYISAGSESHRAPYADGEYNLFNDTMNGYGGSDEMAGDMVLWGEGSVNVDVNGAGEFTMFHDTISGGDGHDLMVGDVYFDGLYGYGESLVNGNIEFHAGGEGEFSLFNDEMSGDSGSDCMIGDLVFDNSSIFDDGSFQVEAEGTGTFSMFNDTMNGGADNDFMVGDVLFDSFYDTFEVDVEGYGEGEGDYGSFNLFNDTMNGGEGSDIMFGDFFWGSLKDLKEFDTDPEGSGFKFGSMIDNQEEMTFDFYVQGGYDEEDPASDIAIFSDILVGGDGDDHLIGQFGADRLTGGAGADTFWFGEGDGSRPTEAEFGQGIDGDLGDLEDVVEGHILEGALNPGDLITDFEVGTDQIGLYGDLNYGDLDFSNDANGNVVMSVEVTGEILATVLGVSADELDNIANFTTL